MAFCEDVVALILFCRYATAFAQSGACWNPSSAISIGKVVLVKRVLNEMRIRATRRQMDCCRRQFCL
ncbi:hypothetical protein KC19_8G036700 [Ceratodon purpureus]|uniref:Secreted protein n=1 Tax=Ceratodon purpureus TaxID=3225 RepID=A0A8T0GYH7_CERPU|nr:hypothetical protein KC19_8G036700 [Ceratodon purpureus]